MNFKNITEDFKRNLPNIYDFIEETSKQYRCTGKEAKALYNAYITPTFRAYESDEYKVLRFPTDENGIIWLSIYNKDMSAKHDWRDFQEIKNNLIGPENEAIELYPAESRKRDIGNAFHLFVMAQPGKKFPVGASSRKVSSIPPDGIGQRPLPSYDPESKLS